MRIRQMKSNQALRNAGKTVLCKVQFVKVKLHLLDDGLSGSTIELQLSLQLKLKWSVN